MSRYPVTFGERAPRKVEKDAVEIMGSTSRANPFFSFRYAYTEISALGGKAHVKSKKTRLEDGKLTSETFEGELERGTYEELLRQAQRYFLGQTTLLLQSLSCFLPPARKQPLDRD
jgi:hypothetical protein